MSYTAAIQTPDEIAATARRNAMVMQYLHLVAFIAKRAWAVPFIRRRLGEFDEAIQAGHCGLLAAAKSYRPEHKSKAKFITYASWAIYRHIIRAARAAGVIYVPEHIQRREPAAALFRFWPRRFPPDCDPPCTDYLPEDDEYDALHHAMDHLPPRQLAMLRERFGFCAVPAGDEHWKCRAKAGRTLEAVGRRHGMSRERARQLERESLAELRAALS